jgi:hypothetical protein
VSNERGVVTDIQTSLAADGDEYAKSYPADRSERGPLDDQEAGSIKPAIDLGALRVEPRRGMQMRLEVEKATSRVVAVTFEYEGSTIQVQPFAAPRSSGLWLGIRQQIAVQIRTQGGDVETVDGEFGPEILATVPVQDPAGYSKRTVRFIGVDGPRWFLRGVVGGPAATNPEAAVAIHDIFRSLVVVRGSTPMPPRDLLPLRVPDSGEEKADTPAL